MTDSLITSILTSWGPFGALLIVAGFAVQRLQRQLSDVQERRIADAQQVTAKMLELVNRQNEITEELTKAIDANADATREMRLWIGEPQRGRQTPPPLGGRR